MRYLALLGALWLASGAALAKKSEPDIHAKRFDSAPSDIFFDDSEVLMLVDREEGVVRRSENAGEDWDDVGSIDKGDPYALIRHPFDNKVAVALGKRKKHWVTEDQGKNWRSFKTDQYPSDRIPISFHATDTKRMLMNMMENDDPLRSIGETIYTTDGFKSSKTLHPRRKSCMWGKGHDKFTTGDEKKDKDLVVCIVEGKHSSAARDYRLVTTTDYFDTEWEPTMSNGRNVPFMSNIASVQSFIVAAARAGNSKEMALYVTKDGAQWHRAEFGDHHLEEDAYTILESSEYSLQVHVMTDRQFDAGILFTSNSNGTYFKKSIEAVNRSPWGFVDFEKIQNIQGIVLVNEIDNWEEHKNRFGVSKKIKSKISFDDGKTWGPLRTGDEELHLHSVTDQRNSGRIFSSPAPGIVMGNGNTGKELAPYAQASLFVSDDAGETWRKTELKGPQRYEFGDQGAVLLAVADVREVDEISYSIDHGHTWKQYELPEKGVTPLDVSTIPDSTSLKFILVAKKDDHFYIFTIDMEGLHERKCEDGDFEKWYARVGKDSKPQCLMGHKQSFRRRKADADCFVEREFKEALPESEKCACTDADFECEYNFRPSGDGTQCEIAGKVPDAEDQCKKPGDTFKGPSGWRLIPGNDCERGSGRQKDDPLDDRKCDEALQPGASGEILISKKTFSGSSFSQFFYLERDQNAQGDDETVVMLTDRLEAWITHDQGKTWKKAVDDDVVAIYPHQYNHNYVYFITLTNKVHYSEDRGKAMHTFEAPEPPNLQGRKIMNFHERNPDWIIWTGGKDCSLKNPYDGRCHNVAHVTRKNGQGWESLLRYVQKCQFMYREGRSNSEDLIYCEQYQAEDTSSPLQLISTEDDFKHKDVQFSSIVDFASMAEYIVVAAKIDDTTLQAQTSIDGRNFAHAAWPPNFEVKHETGYTVLDSSTKSVFLHVTVNPAKNHEYGSILKSNSNGTSYVLSLGEVSRNVDGYVDFEKMQGIEGVALVNVVDNAPDVDKGANKKLKTKITHDDGSFWALLPPPEMNMDNQKYCSGDGIEKCSLHLHGYTERRDPRDTYSSPSAVGLMVGIGNVGEYLGPVNEGDTFLTRDGGVTWFQIQKGTYLWEYGDQGSIIVLVARDTPTDTVLYSTDEGMTWKSKSFNDHKVTVDKISTVPSDNSRNFILWGHEDRRPTTWKLDFTGLTDKQCNLDKENPTADDSDYELWSPQHPHKEVEKDCLFGHKSRYYRKKPAADCYNGPMIDRLHDIERNCSCTRQDFECDYNYERHMHGECTLIPGLSPANPMDVCLKDPNLFEYYDITGYRKVPISTCHGGDEMSFAADSHPCPGKEKEYGKDHGASRMGLFLAIVLPIAAACGVGYWVWKHWDGKFGQIRLGDGTGFAGVGGSGESPWIQWPVAAISALVAVVVAIPMLAGSLWRGVRGLFPGGGSRYGRVPTYASRSAFARGRDDYAAVEDEGELLGDESDEEV